MQAPASCEPGEAPWVVVTRPAPDQVDLIDGVKALGLKVLHAPLHRLEPVDGLVSVLAELDRFDLAIVTSPATARYLLSGTSRERLAGLEWVAPGSGTAQVLLSVGLQVCCPQGGGTSEDLLALPRLESVRGLRIAILGAPGGRRLIADELQRRGAQVEFLYLYRRTPVDLPAKWFELLRSGAKCIVLVSSVQMLEALDDAVPEALRDAWRRCGFVVSSARVEAECRHRGLVDVSRAGGASSVELLKALRRRLKTGLEGRHIDCAGGFNPLACTNFRSTDESGHE